MTYATKIPLLVFGHPLCLARSCFDEELLRCVEDDVVLLGGGDESASDGRNAGRNGGYLGNLHGYYVCVKKNICKGVIVL